MAYTGGGCVNQPVAGLVEIANMAFIDSFPTIPQKLEKCKILIALNLILINIKEFKTPSGDMIGDRIQVELSNALLIEVHKRLLTQNLITENWRAIPESIAFMDLVKSFITEENIEKASKIIINQALKIPLHEVAEFIIKEPFHEFWLSQTLTKEQRTEMMKPYFEISKEIDELVQNAEEISEEKMNILRQTKISCEAKMVEASKNITLASIAHLDIEMPDSITDSIASRNLPSSSISQQQANRSDSLMRMQRSPSPE